MKRTILYPVVFSTAAAAAFTQAWLAQAGGWVDDARSSLPSALPGENATLTRRDRTPETRRTISKERQQILVNLLFSDNDWADLLERDVFAPESAEAISRALAAGDHALALKLVMVEADGSKRKQGVRSIIKDWAEVDAAAALQAVLHLPEGDSESAVAGYLDGLSATAPGVGEAALREAMSLLPSPKLSEKIFQEACIKWVSSGRATGPDLLLYWKETTGSRSDLKFNEGVRILALTAVFIGQMESARMGKAGEEPRPILEPGEYETIRGGMHGLLEILHGETGTHPDSLARLAVGLGRLEDRKTSVHAYQRPEAPELAASYFNGVGRRFADESPASVLPVLSSSDKMARADSEALWRGYVKERAQKKSSLESMAEFSTSEIPLPYLKAAAEEILPKKLQENSIAVARIVNNLPEGDAKDIYRGQMAEWLRKQGSIGEADQWRASVRNPAMLPD